MEKINTTGNQDVSQGEGVQPISDGDSATRSRSTSSVAGETGESNLTVNKELAKRAADSMKARFASSKEVLMGFGDVTDANDQSQLVEKMHNDKELASWCISECLSEEDMDMAIQALNSKHCTLRKLEFIRRKLSDTQCNTLVGALNDNLALEELSLTIRKFDQAKRDAFVQCLKDNTALLQVSINGTNTEMVEFLAANNTIATVFNVQIKKAKECIEEVKRLQRDNEDKQEILSRGRYDTEEEGAELEVSLKIKNNETIKLIKEQLQELERLMSSLNEKATNSGRPDGLSKGHQKRLASVIKESTTELQQLYLGEFEDTIGSISSELYKKYGKMAKIPRRELGARLWRTWVEFFGRMCPDWLGEGCKELYNFRVCLAHAEGSTKEPDASEAALSLIDRLSQFEETTERGCEPEDVPA